VGEVTEPEADPLDPLTRLLTASVGPLLTKASCHATIWSRRRTMVRPERADLKRAGLVLKVDAELVDELAGEFGVGDLVDRPDDLLGVPGHAHVAPRIASVEQAPQLGFAAVVEALVGLGQQPPGPVERVVFAAPVADGLVLHPPPALVEFRVGQPHEMERISHLGHVAKGVVEGLAVRARRVQHPEADRLAPLLGLGLEPCAGTGGAAAGHDVEELGVPGADVDDRVAPVLGTPAPGSAEQRLVWAQRADLADAVRILDQRAAVAITASLTVCQSHPSSRATSATASASAWFSTPAPSHGQHDPSHHESEPAPYSIAKSRITTPADDTTQPRPTCSIEV
jgi:hypothetical protein